MYGSIYPQKLQYKCLTRKAHGNSDHSTDKLFQGQAGYLALGRRYLSRKISPVPQMSRSGLEGWRLIRCCFILIGLTEKLLTSDWWGGRIAPFQVWVGV